jgi:hypothetical protein
MAVPLAGTECMTERKARLAKSLGQRIGRAGYKAGRRQGGLGG